MLIFIKVFQKKGMDLKQAAKFIDQKIKKLGDWILSAEEAVYYGFADGVFGHKGFENLSNIRN